MADPAVAGEVLPAHLDLEPPLLQADPRVRRQAEPGLANDQGLPVKRRDAEAVEVEVEEAHLVLAGRERADLDLLAEDVGTARRLERADVGEGGLDDVTGHGGRIDDEATGAGGADEDERDGRVVR